MTEPEKQVRHYEVRPQAFNQVVNLLAQLPYQQVASTLQLLTEHSKAVFVESTGKIVDTVEETIETKKLEKTETGGV